MSGHWSKLLCSRGGWVVRSSFAGRGPAYSAPQRWDLFELVQCASPGRGGYLIGVCVVCRMCHFERKFQGEGGWGGVRRKLQFLGYYVALFAWSYVQPFWYNTGVWQTDRYTTAANTRASLAPRRYKPSSSEETVQAKVRKGSPNGTSANALQWPWSHFCWLKPF